MSYVYNGVLTSAHPARPGASVRGRATAPDDSVRRTLMQTRPPRLALTGCVLALVSAVTLTACGGSSNSGKAASSTPTTSAAAQTSSSAAPTTSATNT